MKATVKGFCLLLALLILIPISACSDPGEDVGGTETSEPATEADTADPVTRALEELGDVDWGGETFTIVYTDTLWEELKAINGAVGGDSQGSQVINDAVYTRNSLFEDRCKLTLEIVEKNDCEAAIRSDAQSGGEYDMYWTYAWATVNLLTSGYLYSLPDLGIDLDGPWWDAGTAGFALNGKVYFMNGSHNFSDDNMTYVLMFNKEMARTYQVPDLYALARSGDWTLDEFGTVIQGVSSENGDGKWNENDTYGFVGLEGFSKTLFYGSGLQFVINEPDMDAPELYLDDSGHMDKAVRVMDKIRSIYHDGNATLCWPEAQAQVAMDVFLEGRGLFYGEIASYLGGLNRNMEGDYGVVPVPKYDKQQEKYFTFTYKGSGTMSVPSSVKDEDRETVADVVTTFVLLSDTTVKPAYYDTMLTSRNVRDADSAEMLDILFGNRLYDLAMYFDLGFEELPKTAMLATDNNFMSGYTKNAKNFDKKMERMLKSLK